MPAVGDPGMRVQGWWSASREHKQGEEAGASAWARCQRAGAGTQCPEQAGERAPRENTLTQQLGKWVVLLPRSTALAACGQRRPGAPRSSPGCWAEHPTLPGCRAASTWPGGTSLPGPGLATPCPPPQQAGPAPPRRGTPHPSIPPKYPGETPPTGSLYLLHPTQPLTHPPTQIHPSGMVFWGEAVVMV